MNQESAKSVPFFFWVVAVIGLLWNLMGCSVLYTSMFNLEASMEGMTDAAKEWARSIPAWINIVFAVALATGIIGCIGLFLRGKWSFPMFVISLIAVLVQMGYTMIIAGGYQATGPSGMIMPGVVVAIAIFMVWFSWNGQRKGWLV